VRSGTSRVIPRSSRTSVHAFELSLHCPCLDLPSAADHAAFSCVDFASPAAPTGGDLITFAPIMDDNRRTEDWSSSTLTSLF